MRVYEKEIVSKNILSIRALLYRQHRYTEYIFEPSNTHVSRVYFVTSFEKSDNRFYDKQ